MISTIHSMLCMVIIAYAFKFFKNRFFRKIVPPENKAVVITGCSTGFGNLLTRKLDSMGYHVFATTRNPLDPAVRELEERCSPRVRILKLDVRSDESVRDAREFIENHLGKNELWAVVNNAGIWKGLTIELSQINDFVEVMDVNVMGTIRVTKALLPLVKKYKGRFVNLSSPAGRTAMFFLAPYTVSKHASLGFTNALRQELKLLDISVVSVEPEMFRTNFTDIGRKGQETEALLSSLNKNERFTKSVRRVQDFILSSSSPKTDLVINDLVSAVTLVNPCSVYKTRRSIFTRLFFFMLEVTPLDLQDFLVHFVLKWFQRKKTSKRRS